MKIVVWNVIVRQTDRQCRENDCILLFADFCCQLRECSENNEIFRLGALSYTAPEIFESGEYTIQSDIYSYGNVLLDMITCDMLNVSIELDLFMHMPEISMTRMKKRYNYVFVHVMIRIRCRKVCKFYAK